MPIGIRTRDDSESAYNVNGISIADITHEHDAMW